MFICVDIFPDDSISHMSSKTLLLYVYQADLGLRAHTYRVRDHVHNP